LFQTIQTANQLKNAVMLGPGKPPIQLQQRWDRQQEIWSEKAAAAAAVAAQAKAAKAKAAEAAAAKAAKVAAMEAAAASRACVYIDEDLLVHSSKSSSGFKGVRQTCVYTVAGTRPHAKQHPAPRTTSAPSAPHRTQPRRTCSTGRRTTRARWRRSGRKDHQPPPRHLESSCRLVISCSNMWRYVQSSFKKLILQ
jgi:hypothetical protein